jgi:hypothetical protein
MKHLKIFENFHLKGDSPRKEFTDSQIAYYEKIWKTMPYRYTQNKFFSSVWERMKTKKSLTQNQWIELEFLFKNGKSRYEAGQLSSKH